MTSTSFGQSFSEGETILIKVKIIIKPYKEKTQRRSQFSNGIVLNIEVLGQTFIQVGDKINLEIGSTSTTVDETDDDSLTGTYIVMKLRHIFIQSRENKHRILMEVARDSKIGEFFQVKVSVKGKEIAPLRLLKCRKEIQLYIMLI